MSPEKIKLSFWEWLFSGTGGRPGYRRVLRLDTTALLLASIVGGFFLTDDLESVSEKLLIPLGSALVGMSVNWAIAAVSMTSNKALVRLARANRGGIQNYIYPFQLGFLITLLAIFFWSLGAVGAFSWLKPIAVSVPFCGLGSVDIWYKLAKIIMLFFLLLSAWAVWKMLSMLSKQSIASFFTPDEPI